MKYLGFRESGDLRHFENFIFPPESSFLVFDFESLELVIVFSFSLAYFMAGALIIVLRALLVVELIEICLIVRHFGQCIFVGTCSCLFACELIVVVRVVECFILLRILGNIIRVILFVFFIMDMGFLEHRIVSYLLIWVIGRITIDLSKVGRRDHSVGIVISWRIHLRRGIYGTIRTSWMIVTYRNLWINLWVRILWWDIWRWLWYRRCLLWCFLWMSNFRVVICRRVVGFWIIISPHISCVIVILIPVDSLMRIFSLWGILCSYGLWICTLSQSVRSCSRLRS